MKNTKNITVDAIILGYKREKNLPLVIQGLKRQSFVRDIYLFHNSPSKKKVSGVINIVSEKNFGCIGRHAIALLSDADYVLFVDDDLVLKEDFSDRFCEALEINDNSIIGMFGGNIDVNNGNNMYTQRAVIYYQKFFRYVDIIIGKVHLCNKNQILNLFRFIHHNLFKINGLKKNDFIMDDIFLNISNQIDSKIPSLLIPVNKDELYYLNDKLGSENSESHYDLRNKILVEALKMAWVPRADKGKFFKHNVKLGRDNLEAEKSVKRIRHLLKENDILEIEKEYNKLTDKNLLISKDIYNIAGLFREAKNITNAEECYNLVLGNDNSTKKKISGLSYYHLGQIYKDRGDIVEAKKHLTNCLKKIPDHHKANELLKKIK